MSAKQETDLEVYQQASIRLMGLASQILTYCRRYEAAHDERAVFAFMYSKMTEYLAIDLKDAKVEFHEPEWIAMLAEAFAMRFVKAMDAIDAWLQVAASHGQRYPSGKIYGMVPKPWADVYLANCNGQSYVLEDMIFSLMAHISHDLPLALLEVKMETNGQSHVADYHLMNQVLASRINEIQKVVAQRYNRFLAVLDRWAGPYDVFFTNYGIRLARSVSWYNAYRISDPLSAQDARQSIEGSTAAFIGTIRRPKTRWLRIWFRIARFIIPHRRKWPKSRA